MDYTQQAAILGDEDLTADLPPPEIIPIPAESAKKSKKQPVKVMKEVIRCFLSIIPIHVYTFEVWKLAIKARGSWVCLILWFGTLLVYWTNNTVPSLFQLSLWTRGKCLQLDWQYSRGACSCTRRTFSRWSSWSDQQIHAQLQGSPFYILYIHSHICMTYMFLPPIAIFWLKMTKWEYGLYASLRPKLTLTRYLFTCSVLSDYILSFVCVFRWVTCVKSQMVLFYIML